MKKYDSSLWSFLQRKTNKFGLQKRIDLAIKVVEEVAKAHEYGKMVHRDIKPSNVMLDSNMNPVLVDFGIGRFFEEFDLNVSVCTPGFTAPEQISGDSQYFSVDVFSLGKLLVLILFKWQVGWKMLWSPIRIPESEKLAAFGDFVNMIRLMLQVTLN